MVKIKSFIICLTVALFSFTFAQGSSTANDDDGGYFQDESGTEPAPATPSGNVQNAIIEGVQITSDHGSTLDEKVVTCYFIFRDKPSSYFYEAKPKEKVISFEFHDVSVGASPIPSIKEPPIQGFRIEQEKVDANKDVVGLRPEMHDVCKVTMYFDNIPEISVKDEYSIISFSFRWSTDPGKQKQLVQEKKSNKVLLFSAIGGGLLVGGGVATLVVLSKGGEKPVGGPAELDASDLPVHPPR